MRYLIIILLVAISCVTYAQNPKINSPSKEPKFSIKVILADSGSYSSGNLSLKTYEYQSIFGLKLNSYSTGETSLFRTKAFQKQIDIHNQNAVLTIGFSGAGEISKNRMLQGYFGYLVNTGDNLTCIIYKDSISFTGLGSTKMNLQTQLFKLGEQFSNSPNKTYESGLYFLNIKEQGEIIFNQRMNLLEKHKADLTDADYKYLYYEILGGKYLQLMTTLNTMTRINLDIMKKQAIDFFYEYINEDSLIINDNMYTSSSIIDYLYLKEKFKFEQTNKINASVNINGSEKLFDKLINKYTGRIRDRIMIDYFIDMPKQYLNTFESIDKALKLVTNQRHKNILLQIKNANAKDKPAYFFSLPDSTGKLIKLNHFKGKVVVLEFWFTGCIPCKALSKEMIPIMEHFKNEDVVFITINCNQKKEQWYLGLKSGEYTHEQTINLATGGFEHELLLHYNINSFPRLIIIDKEQKLISSIPPRPINETDKNQFIKMIEAAL